MKAKTKTARGTRAKNGGVAPPAGDAGAGAVTALELELHDLRAEVDALREAARLKDQYLAVATHELSAPLASMKAYIEALIEGQGDPAFTEGDEFLRVLDRETTRLTRVVERTLELSRLARRQGELRIQPTDLVQVAADVQSSVQPLLSERSMRLIVDVATDVPVVAADPDLLKQVLLNLVHNSIKFSPPGSSVWVCGVSNGSGVVVEVRDQGHGIAPHEQEHVFEPWFRSADERIARARGTGLGLSIVKTIVEQHGSHIKIDSTLHVGTSFQFTLSRF